MKVKYNWSSCGTAMLSVACAFAVLVASVIVAFALTTSAYADALTGAIAVPRRDGMVCDKAEDVLPANDAWRRLVDKNISKDEFEKWVGRCGLIKSGKAALVRDEMKTKGGGTLVCSANLRECRECLNTTLTSPKSVSGVRLVPKPMRLSSKADA